MSMTGGGTNKTKEPTEFQYTVVSILGTTATDGIADTVISEKYQHLIQVSSVRSLLLNINAIKLKSQLNKKSYK